MSVHFQKGRGRGSYCGGAEVSWGQGWLCAPGLRAAPRPTPNPSCPNTTGLLPSHGLALDIIEVMNNGFLFPAFWCLTLCGSRFPDIVTVGNLLFIRSEMKSTLLLAAAVQEAANAWYIPAQGQQQSPLDHHSHPSCFQCFQTRHLLLCATPLSGDTPLGNLVCGQCQEDCLHLGLPCSPTIQLRTLLI